MNTNLYLLTQIGFAVLTFLFFGLLLKQLKSALNKSEFEESKKSRVFYSVLGALVLWTIIVSILASKGFFLNFDSVPPPFSIILLIPLVTLIWALLFSPTTKILLTHIPPQALIQLQVFRVFVELLLWLLFIQNLLPVQMTFEGRNLDILSGLTAPFIAYFGFTRMKLGRKIIIFWNFPCLGLLLNIVITAILSMPTQFRYFMNEPANTIVGHFPIIWLPALLVPLAYGLHFLSLRQLMIQKSS